MPRQRKKLPGHLLYGKRNQAGAQKKGQGGTSSLFVCPLQGAGAAPLLGFGATPQLFLVKPIQKEQPTKVQAAKRPCQ